MASRRFPVMSLAMFLLAGVVVVALWRANLQNGGSHADRSQTTTAAANLKIEEPSKPRRHALDPSVVDYVGSTACRDCHHEIWEKYQKHPMANSCSKVTVASPTEDYITQTEFSPPGHRSYRVERTAAEVRHHEIMVDQQGDVIYDQSVPVEYAVGSGKRGRGYLIDHDGFLFQSSISWYSDRRAWGLSPEYPTEHHPRFERRVTGSCLTCHTGLPNFIRDEADRFEQPRFLEEAIGCERCHGPGRKHVAARESGEAANDPIVNPVRLEVDRREAVCAQCHLRTAQVGFSERVELRTIFVLANALKTTGSFSSSRPQPARPAPDGRPVMSNRWSPASVSNAAKGEWVAFRAMIPIRFHPVLLRTISSASAA